MIIEELIEPAPTHVERLQRAQDRERADRNTETLRAWYVSAFGEVVGTRLWTEHCCIHSI